MSTTIEIERVLQVHTRYREPGGEDRVVEAERALLEGAGMSVRQVIFDNADVREARSPLGDARIAASAVWNGAASRRVRDAVREHRPDAVHVHNTFVAASPAIYGAAGGPVVQTLHNYRFVCPAATAFRDGRPCLDCVGRGLPAPAVVHRCVRGSLGQSVVASGGLAFHRAVGTFRRGIGTYLALTAFQRSVLVDGGLPERRVRILPNFLEPDPGVGTWADRQGLLFVGRLVTEKGIGPLLRAAAAVPGVVRIVGSGPFAQAVEEAAAAGHVIQLGRLAGAPAVAEMRHALALVLPSIWFEGFPMVVLEAYASGTPVIASRIGSLADIVEDGVTGLLAEPGDAADLARKMHWALEHTSEMTRMGAAARARYESRYRGAEHLAALLDAYRELAPARASLIAATTAA